MIGVPNATVEYVDESGRVIATEQFRDPGLDPTSVYARDWLRRAQQPNQPPRPYQPHMAYGCGRPL